MTKRYCKWGKLKNPVGRRICKKKPKRILTPLTTKEKASHDAYRANYIRSGVAGYRRRSRR